MPVRRLHIKNLLFIRRADFINMLLKALLNLLQDILNLRADGT